MGNTDKFEMIVNITCLVGLNLHFIFINAKLTLYN